MLRRILELGYWHGKGSFGQSGVLLLGRMAHTNVARVNLIKVGQRYDQFTNYAQSLMSLSSGSYLSLTPLDYQGRPEGDHPVLRS
jgi:hypothetical protein